MPPTSPTHSPRQSDISFSSVHTTFSTDVPRKPSSTSKPLPVHCSTSTISTHSRASNDEQSIFRACSRHGPFLESPSCTRLPKARVFVHRDKHRERTDRPRTHTSERRNDLHHRPLTPTPYVARQGLPRHVEKRCISDLQDAFRTRAPDLPRMATPAPQAWQRARVKTELAEVVDFLKQDEELPGWIPSEELQNWTPPPPQDPCDVEDGQGSKWASSLRNISNFYRTGKDKNPPCIRGSILEVHPPTFTERIGLGGLGADRKAGSREVRTGTGGRGRFAKRGKRVDDDWPRGPKPGRAANLRGSPRGVAHMADDDGRPRGDDYVGFLVESEEKTSRSRRGWLRFLKRGKA